MLGIVSHRKNVFMRLELWHEKSMSFVMRFSSECAGFPRAAAICHTQVSDLQNAMKSDIIIVSLDTKI